MECLDRQVDTGSDDAAEIGAIRVDDIESGGGTEVDDDAGAAVFFECSYGIYDAVGADFRGIVVMHRHAGFNSGLDQERLGIEVALADLPQHGIERRHYR